MVVRKWDFFSFPCFFRSFFYIDFFPGGGGFRLLIFGGGRGLIETTLDGKKEEKGMYVSTEKRKPAPFLFFFNEKKTNDIANILPTPAATVIRVVFFIEVL